MMTMQHHPPALADAMALLRVIMDPEAAQASLDTIAAALAAQVAEVEKRETAFAAACAAREKALDAREEALKRSEAELAGRRKRLAEALAGLPGGAR
jgi:septal ring factor EnvC (AmiA/AmiB activator)